MFINKINQGNVIKRARVAGGGGGGLVVVRGMRGITSVRRQQ